MDIEETHTTTLSIGEAFRRELLASGLIPSGEAHARSPETDEQRSARVRADLYAKRLSTFKEKCPPEFAQKIDRQKLPNLIAWDAADAWDGGHPGLWLWSNETGRGKTRMLWSQFGRQHVKRGRSVVRISGVNLGEEYFRYHMEGFPSRFYDWITRYDILMIDDIDKIDLDNNRNPRMVHDLFNRIYEQHIPCLVTANESIEFFQKRIGQSTERRMSAVCREIQF